MRATAAVTLMVALAVGLLGFLFRLVWWWEYKRRKDK